MSNNSSAKTPRETVLAEIALVPLLGEEDDFQTITTVEEVRDDLLSAAAAFPDSVASSSSRGTRDAGIILLVGELARQVLSQQDLLIELFKAGAAAISLLGKRDHIV